MSDKNAEPAKISKCVATPTNVVVYFSAPIDVTVENNPNETANYAVRKMGATIALDYAQYDVIQRASVLQLNEPQAPGESLEITVANLKSHGVEVDASPANCTIDGETAKAKKKPTVDLQLMKKILQPSYAIGMGIITQDDYNNLKNEYFAQSELTLGLMIPLILIVLGLALTPQIGLAPKWIEKSLVDDGSWWAALPGALTWYLMCAALVPISMALFLVGAERYHKYRMELKLLILGNWQKQQEAKEAAAGGTNGTSGKTPNKSNPGAGGGVTGGGATKISVDPITVDLRPSQAPTARSQSGSGTVAPASNESTISGTKQKLSKAFQETNFENESETQA